MGVPLVPRCIAALLKPRSDHRWDHGLDHGSEKKIKKLNSQKKWKEKKRKKLKLCYSSDNLQELMTSRKKFFETYFMAINDTLWSVRSVFTKKNRTREEVMREFEQRYQTEYSNTGGLIDKFS